VNATEQIVRIYYEHLHNVFTKANIKGSGQCELDLIGIKNDAEITYYHIETSVSLSDGFSIITNNAYSPEKEKERTSSASQKKTAGYFINKKFNTKEILATYKKNGIDKTKIKKIVVAWDFNEEAKNRLNRNSIECKSMKEILQEMVDHMSLETANIDNDILKTIQLLIRANINMPKSLSNATARKKKKERDNGMKKPKKNKEKSS